MFRRVNFIPPFILMGITEIPLGSAEEWQKVPEQHRCGPQILRSLCYKSGSIPKGNSGAWDDFPEQIQSSLTPFPTPPPHQSLDWKKRWYLTFTSLDPRFSVAQVAWMSAPHFIYPTRLISSPQRTRSTNLPPNMKDLFILDSWLSS